VSDDLDLEGTLSQITALVEGVEHLPDREARERARALVHAVLDIHRVGLARVLALAGAREGGSQLVDELAEDRAIALLLSLHELHPRDVESRVAAAVEQAAARLREVGVALDAVGVTGDSARVRVKPAGPVRASPAQIRSQIEEAIGRAAPEIAEVEIDGLDPTPLVSITLPRR
jgi:hypothetical protein